MQIIKNMNGYTDKEFSCPDKIERIELVLEEFGRMDVVGYFKNLKSLTLINTSIYNIEVYSLIKGTRPPHQTRRNLSQRKSNFQHYWPREVPQSQESLSQPQQNSRVKGLAESPPARNPLGLRQQNRRILRIIPDNRVSRLSPLSPISNNSGLPRTKLIRSGLTWTNSLESMISTFLETKSAVSRKHST